MIPILLVDDEPALLEIAKIFIEREGGYQVTTCSSAFDAVKILENSRFAVIISDYEMPAMDGIEFLKKIRTMGNSTPFIIFTGRGREQVVIEALNYGADFYLQKGGDPKSQFAELRNMIQQAVKRIEAEEAFRRSERQLFEIINFLPDATFAIDREGKVIAWNRAIEEMTGIPANEMLGKGDMEYALPFYGIRRKILIDLLFEKDEDIIGHYYSHIVRNGHGIIAETEVTMLHKKPVIVWAKATPFYDENNNVIGAVESIRDITDLKRYEETMAGGENQFQELADQLPQGVYEIDLQGSILYANYRTLDLFGYPRDSPYTGYNIFRMLVPEEHERARLGISATIESRRILGNIYTAIKRDGTTFQVWIFTSPIVTDGTVTGIRGTIIDLSDLDIAEERLRAAIDGGDICTWEYDAKTRRIVRVNEKWNDIFGYSPEQMGITLDELMLLIHPDDRIRTEKSITELIEGRTTNLGIETRLKCSNGTFKWILIRGKPVKDDDQPNLPGIAGTIQDISDMWKYRDIIEISNRKLYLLNSITRHDLQNQLTILNGALELAKTGTADERSDFLTMAEKAVASMTKMISFTREYQDIGVREPIWQSVGDVARRAAGSLHSERIAIDIHVGNVCVFADRLLEKVFYNLFDNALRYGGEPLTTIQVLAREGEPGLFITVEDDGIGITRKDKEKIFERGVGQNTGLGLFLAREILSITGITIRETGLPGKGARFEISVPGRCCEFTCSEGQGAGT